MGLAVELVRLQEVEEVVVEQERLLRGCIHNK